MKFVQWAAIAVSPLAMIAGFLTAGHASASPTPSAQICGDFHTWNAHRTIGTANAMMADVMRLPWVKYVSEDMTSTYADYRGGTKYLATDVRYDGEDCP
jgi:hypothetical protein